MRLLLQSMFLVLAMIGEPAAAKPPAVHLELDGGRRPNEQQSLRLAQLARELLESANFNTIDQPDQLQQRVPHVHQRYRRVIAGNHLIISYQRAVAIETVGGRVEVFEIVIGVARQDMASDLFTIDREGRVVAHEKYSGLLALRLRQVIGDATDG